MWAEMQLIQIWWVGTKKRALQFRILATINRVGWVQRFCTIMVTVWSGGVKMCLEFVPSSNSIFYNCKPQKRKSFIRKKIFAFFSSEQSFFHRFPRNGCFGNWLLEVFHVAVLTHWQVPRNLYPLIFPILRRINLATPRTWEIRFAQKRNTFCKNRNMVCWIREILVPCARTNSLTITFSQYWGEWTLVHFLNLRNTVLPLPLFG